MTPPASEGAPRPPWWRRGGAILAGRGADAGLRFLLFLATARVLAPEEFATYALLTAALVTAQALAAFGAPRAALYWSGRGAGGALVALLLVGAAAGGLLGIGVPSALPFLRALFFRGLDAPLVALGLAPLPFLLLGDSLAAVLLGARRERLYTAFLLARAAGSGAVLAASLAAPDRLTFLLAGRVVVQALVALGLFAFVPRPTRAGVARLLPDAVRFAWPAAVSSALVSLHRRQDVLLLSAFGRREEIGAYAVAYAVAETFWLVTESLEAALFVDLAGRDEAAAYAQARRAFRLYAGLGLAAAALGLAAGPPLVSLAFGARYPAAAALFPWALLAAVAWGVARPFTSFLYARGLGRFVSATHAAGVLLNAALCAALVPRWGARGAAVSSLASYAAETVVVWRLFAARSRA